MIVARTVRTSSTYHCDASDLKNRPRDLEMNALASNKI